MKPVVVEKAVAELISPVLEQDEMELVEVVYRFENGRWVLRIYVDQQNGVNLGDCARISRGIEDLIEIEEVIPNRYCLEVSSPGLDRVLNKEADFKRFSGKMARVVLREPREGRKNFKGKIVGCQSEIVELEDSQGNLCRLPLREIKRARLEIETKIGGQVNRVQGAGKKARSQARAVR